MRSRFASAAPSTKRRRCRPRRLLRARGAARAARARDARLAPLRFVDDERVDRQIVAAVQPPRARAGGARGSKPRVNRPGGAQARGSRPPPVALDGARQDAQRREPRCRVRAPSSAASVGCRRRTSAVIVEKRRSVSRLSARPSTRRTKFAASSTEHSPSWIGRPPPSRPARARTIEDRAARAECSNRRRPFLSSRLSDPEARQVQRHVSPISRRPWARRAAAGVDGRRKHAGASAPYGIPCAAYAARGWTT